MKPLIVLLAAFGISLFILRLINGQYEWALSGRIAMSAMLAFTAMGHFVFAEGMAMMVPGIVPYKKQLVYLTGIFEIAAAIGLLIPSLYRLTSWSLIVFFVLILPANINAALKRVDFQKKSNDGSGVGYLWFRVPLQIVFILWTYYSGIRS
ncbi:MAG: hypothetical protein C5B59_02165 [Bacteroidetes bacterium]|nr:MAG: hypothetical protein C5B59_02165 [Bacteroidota bacterium]